MRLIPVAHRTCLKHSTVHELGYCADSYPLFTPEPLVPLIENVSNPRSYCSSPLTLS